MRVGPPFEISHIDHVLLLVDGMQESLAFYEGVLGCVVESRLPEYGMVELRAGSSHLDLVDVAAAEGSWARPEVRNGRNVDHVALRLDGCTERALREHLAASRTPIAEERIERDGLMSFYVRDPSGNTIELAAVAASP
jgi:glyoxylase I family protein